MALSATANAELKVATVDVQKLFADYYKTHEAQAEVDKAAQTVQETLPQRFAFNVGVYDLDER